MDRTGLNCESSNLKWETAPVRTKLDMSEGSLLPLPPGKCVHVPIDIAENPFEIFEPPSPKHSGHHVGGKILKFLKLQKKSNSESTFSREAFQPSLTTFRFQDQSRSSVSVEDVDMERYHYDSDQHSEGVNCDLHLRSSSSSASDASSSASDACSSRSSASAQSFNSMTSRVSVTPPASFRHVGSGPLSGAQLMANILISISNLSGGDECDFEYNHSSTMDGPHESAWHQPRDEMSAASIGRHSSAKHNSGRITPRLGRCSTDLHLTSPGPSRRFGKLDLPRLDKLR